MTTKIDLNLIKQGEGIDIEFKECKNKLNKNVFETVCAFLNRNGGHIFLGVKDNGDICGIEATSVEKVYNDLLTALNNPQKIYPSVYLKVQIVHVKNKKIIYIFVPESSSVHKTAGKIYDRNGDCDFDITDKGDLVANLYLRKQTDYTENRIYPYATLDDLKPELLKKVRLLASNQRVDEHPWNSMTDIELLKSSGLYKTDRVTGKSGLTLAAILLFGTDEAIISVLPHHKTDAILRKINTDRYDDRDVICTNLLESYTRLMAFVKKHLKDPFYMEDTQRISIRNKIFREVIVNTLIHREFSNAFPAKMIIEKDKVLFENANKPHGYGEIDPNNFVPFPKNPTIAKIFREIGFADELGSGVKNLFKYTKKYGGANPRLLEKDIFQITLPLKIDMILETSSETSSQTDSQTSSQTDSQTSSQTGSQTDSQTSSQTGSQTDSQTGSQTCSETSSQTDSQTSSQTMRKILKAISIDPKITTVELSDFCGISRRTIQNYINKLKTQGKLRRVGADFGGHWEIIDD